MTRSPSIAALAAALGLAVLAPAASAQDPAAMLDAAADAAAIPHESVISDQYREIETVVREALPAAPAAPPAAPPPAPKPPPAPPKAEYHPPPEQYHSKAPSNVTVTQSNPENVNVSIRVHSPGDDGPVTQVNAGGGVSVSPPPPPPKRPEPPPRAPAEPAEPAPPSPEPPAGPETWEWVWTSACFGGGGGGPAAAASSAPGGGPRWVWRWSCAEDVAPTIAAGIGEIVDEVTATAGELPAAALLAAPSGGADPPEPARARPERARPTPAAAPARRPRPPPAARAVLARAELPAPSAAGAPARAAPAAATPAPAEPQARPRRAADLLPSPGDGGPAAGPASGLGGAASLLLAGWLAVLVLALGLVLPRLWLRRWSGPAWRLPAPRATRLERPG